MHLQPPTFVLFLGLLNMYLYKICTPKYSISLFPDSASYMQHQKHHSSYDDDEYIPILYNMYIKCWVLLSFPFSDVSCCCVCGMKNQVKIKIVRPVSTSTINVCCLFLYLLLMTLLLDGSHAMSCPKTNTFGSLSQIGLNNKWFYVLLNMFLKEI